MSRPLVIVESPAKAKTIARHLGGGYDVRASVGHIADLPTKGLGVDVDNGFKPEWELTSRGKEVVKELRSLAHRFELINRHRVFAWVASSGLPAVANGDFHVPEHVDTWKTLLPCARTREAVVGFLRSEAPAALTRVEPEGFAPELRETA